MVDVPLQLAEGDAAALTALFLLLDAWEKEMVGTTRFELATSPTPRVRSTRLSHVPTFVASAAPVFNPRGDRVISVYNRWA